MIATMKMELVSRLTNTIFLANADVTCIVEDKPGIQDMTETNLVNLRRTIYLTIMNAVSTAT